MSPRRSLVGAICWLILSSAAVLPHAADARSYDAFSDFSLSDNPSGPWSYGRGTAGSSFTLYRTSATNCTSVRGLSCWAINGQNVPYVGENTTGNTISFGSLTLPTGLLDMHPASEDDTIVQWTASSSGMWQIDGFYELLDASSVGATALIYAGTTQLLDAALSTSSPTDDFSFTAYLNAGDILEFAEGPNASGGIGSDSTGFDVTIHPAPEPVSFLLFATGLAGLGMVRRRA